MTGPASRAGDTGRWASVGDYAARLGVAAESLPRSVRIVLEAALVGHATGRLTDDDCTAIAQWMPGAAGQGEWRFPIGRVLMQDASGLPLLADLAALRDALAQRGRDPAAIDLAVPATLVIDHSVDADHWGDAGALTRNMAAEFARNEERYVFARWAEQAFGALTVVPPGNGIVHQVHLERIANPVCRREGWMLCDTVIGTDSHTTMVNGLGVLGWGVGGIEAEAALLGQPVTLAVPEIIGVELTGRPGPGVHGADLALALTAWLRQQGVVGAFLEFHGAGASALSVADRASMANMAPEYGAMLALFPSDEAVLGYLAEQGRAPADLAAARTHLLRQGLFGDVGAGIAYDRRLRFDLSAVAPALAGPFLPHQRAALPDVAQSFAEAFPPEARDGRVVLAAITSCTNTANLPSLVAAGLLARAALGAGMTPPPHVKTVFAPGSRATTARLAQAGLLDPLERLGFHVAAYGCGPCVGNTGDLAEGVEASLGDGRAAVAVLSGNRNFEGRIHHAIRAGYLASPMLVVAYALAGRIDADIGALLARLAPSEAEIGAALRSIAAGAQPAASPDWYLAQQWARLPVPEGSRFDWSPGSSFFVPPPFFEMAAKRPLLPLAGARPLLVLGDSVTTDHISPVGAIARGSDAARYLGDLGVAPGELGSYSARRVNHHVMRRGTFANPRLRNRLVEPSGPVSRAMPSGAVLPVAEVADAYAVSGTPLVVLAGELYGAGSARDWAAKGTALLGVSAVIARSFERIHRSNLVALGILPIEIAGPGDPWAGISPASNVTVAVAAPGEGALAPNMSLAVTLTVDGESRILDGILRVATMAEIAQLAAGTMFDLCLGEALGKPGGNGKR